MDVGAGTGQFLSYARRNFEISGTEVSGSAIRIARDKYGVDLIRGGIEDADLGGRRFDVITAFHVLEHVHSPSSVIEKCRRILNEEGVIIISVPNEIDSLTALVKRSAKYLLSRFGFAAGKRYGACGLRKIELGKDQDEIHLSYFTVDSLKRLLAKNGLIVIDETLDPYYATTGPRRFSDDILFGIFLGIKNIFRVNLYDAIWIAAKVNNNLQQ
jgi:2-polyprenyl-3-methyl-5-hydroxy-6-metoxy-1,4-benzoquinol methylase